MRDLSGTLMVAAALAYGQAPLSVDFHHVYTFGSKQGIHPPRILNRRPATAAFGEGEHPYGLAYPAGVATDVRQRVWITDRGTASVHVFDPASGAYREIRRVGGVPLQQPSGIAADDAGRIYLTDSANGGVYVFDENGEYDRALVKRGERLLENPTVIALSEDGRTIYVADPPRNAIVELNREGEVNGTIQLPPELGAPLAISVVANEIYVLGERRHIVEIFSPNGSVRGELRWDGVKFPTAFAYDPGQRRFLVANPEWGVVEILNAEGHSLGVFGQRGEGVDQMERTDALHIDPHGLVYVVDSHHGKVLVFADARDRRKQAGQVN
jgi:DNA-binding beta-propeller fold protein YncE